MSTLDWPIASLQSGPAEYSMWVPVLPLKSIPDDQLAAHLCQYRAVCFLPYSANDIHKDCQRVPTTARQISLPYAFWEEYVIASLVNNKGGATLQLLQGLQ